MATCPDFQAVGPATNEAPQLMGILKFYPFTQIKREPIRHSHAIHTRSSGGESYPRPTEICKFVCCNFRAFTMLFLFGLSIILFFFSRIRGKTGGKLFINFNIYCHVLAAKLGCNCINFFKKSLCFFNTTFCIYLFKFVKCIIAFHSFVTYKFIIFSIIIIQNSFIY